MLGRFVCVSWVGLCVFVYLGRSVCALGRFVCVCWVGLCVCWVALCVYVG